MSWDNPVDRVIVGPEMLKDMEEKVVRIKQNLNIAQDRQKSYADKNKNFREFQVGEHVFLKVRVKTSSLKLGNYKKLATRLCGPFEILSRIGLVAYELALPPCIKVHNVFHVSLLKKYIHDPNHLVDWHVIQFKPEGGFQVQLVSILDKKVKMLQNRAIGQVKVQWRHFSPEDATWELEDEMRKAYPHLF